MSAAANLPAWALLLVAVLVLLSASLTLVGTIGLLRFKTFYERTHAPTLGTTLGIGLMLFASMIYFSVLQHRLVLHELLIAVFMTVTTPITLVLLVRAALYRDRYAGSDKVPPTSPPKSGLLEKQAEPRND